MTTRYFASVTMGSGVTFCLLFLMQHLISMGEEVITPSPEGPPVNFVRVDPDDDVKSKRERVKPPKEPPLPPTIEQPRVIDSIGGQLVKVLGLPPTVPGHGRDPLMGYAQNGELLPIVTVAPAYPARAIARHLEGYVIVEYTVTVTGGVRDAFVVTSTSSIFDRSAVEAACKFKYKPRVVDGQPVETPGVRRRFSFVLED